MPSPTRTLSIGGATFDLFVHTECPLTAITPGCKVPVRDVTEACGGGASNTAVGLRRLGCDAAFSGIVGSDQWGEALLQNLRREGVYTDTLTQVEGETTSFSIIVNIQGGERIIFYTPGTNAHLHDTTFDRTYASSVDWIYLNHLNDASCMIEDDLIAVLAAPNGPRLTWNPGGNQIAHGIDRAENRALLAHTDLLLLNREEALAFSGQVTLGNAFRQLHALGPHIVAITDGANGATAFDGASYHFCPALPSRQIIDTTGAGDAFGTAMTYGLISGWDLPNCLRAGTINAASVLSHIGAERGLLTDTEMQRRLSSVHLDVEALPSLP